MSTLFNKKINTLAPYRLVKTMRAGVLVLGSLLTKYRKAKRFAWTMEKAPSDFSGRKKPALPCHEMWKKRCPNYNILE